MSETRTAENTPTCPHVTMPRSCFTCGTGRFDGGVPMTSVPPATGTSEDATCEHALTKIWRGQARCTRCGAPARTAENDAPIADEWQCTCDDLNHPCEVHDTDADPRWNQ